MSKFQSLSRDSVCLDYSYAKSVQTKISHVSIPESGFCLFGLYRLSVRNSNKGCFNP